MRSCSLAMAPRAAASPPATPFLAQPPASVCRTPSWTVRASRSRSAWAASRCMASARAAWLARARSTQ